MADVSGLIRTLTLHHSRVFNSALNNRLSAVRTAAPVGETGATRRGLRITNRTASRTRYRATIETPTPQAAWTDEGTSEHPIDPVSAKVLRFVIPGAGVVYTTHVDHPGSKKHKGWFSDEMKQSAWTTAVRRAALSA